MLKSRATWDKDDRAVDLARVSILIFLFFLKVNLSLDDAQKQSKKTIQDAQLSANGSLEKEVSNLYCTIISYFFLQ